MPPESIELPFECTLDDLSAWLACLPTHERDRYPRLFAGLQALNEFGPEPKFYYAALNLFSMQVFKAGDVLVAQFLGKPLPLEPGVRKLAKLSAQFHTEMAKGYYKITQHSRFDTLFDWNEQGRIIHSAYRCYNQMVVRLALMYEAVASSMWLRLHEFYRLAERESLLQWADACPEMEHAPRCSIEALYLRMFTFRLTGPYRLSQPDIQRVFELVQAHSAIVSLSRNSNMEGRRADFVLDLSSGALPRNLAGAENTGNAEVRYLYFDALRKVIDALARPPLNKDSGFSANLSGYLQVRLGGGNLGVMPDTRSRGSTLIIGYANLVVSMSAVGEANTNLQLLENVETTAPALSKSSGTFNPLASAFIPKDKQASGFICQVNAGNMPGFYVLESLKIALAGGTLLGLFTDGKLVQFGIICPGRCLSGANDYGFELLATHVRMVKAYFDVGAKKPYPCFVSAFGDNRYSLITRPLRLRNGEGMSLREPDWQLGAPMQRYRIARLLEKTTDFCQFEIIPEQAA